MKWTCTYLSLPYDENDPLNRTRMAICGSFRDRFEFLVPPGTYDFSASSGDPSSATLEPRSVTVTADQKEVDLGGLVLRPRIGGFQNLVDRAKAQRDLGRLQARISAKNPRPGT